MKKLRLSLYVIFVLIHIPFIVGLFIERKFEIEKEVLIEKPIDEVFSYVKDLRNQQEYSAWIHSNTHTIQKVEGPIAKNGFTVYWESKRPLNSSIKQSIIQIVDKNTVETQIHFDFPFKWHYNMFFYTDSIDENSTKVIWKVKGENPYPFNSMNLFSNFRTNNLLKIEESMQMLKEKLEN